MTAASFAYHRSVAPLLWVFVALAGVELLVVHFLLALWFPRVALIVSAAALMGLVWLIRAIRSFRSMPVLIGDEWLVMRAGRLRRHCIRLTDIAGFREHWSGGDLQQRGVSNLALIAYPNIMLDLKDGVRGRRGPLRAIAHKLDDPLAFRAALTARLEALGS